MNYDLFRRMMNEKAKEDRIPLSGIFELTARCTLNCHFCYVHTLDAAATVKRELSTEQWKRIFSQTVDAGMLRATLSGGECLLREDFRELYRFLYDKGVMMTVKTNGTLLTEDDLAFFRTYRPEWLEITLYGSDNGVYASVCGAPVFDRVLRTVRTIREQKLPLKLDLTFSRRNVADAEALLSCVAALGVPYQITDWLIPPRDGTCRSDICLTNDERVRIAEMDWSLRGGKPFAHEDTAPAPCGGCTDEKRGLSCNAGSCLFSVTYTGEMTPCFTVPGISVSLLAHSFAEAWQEITRRTAAIRQPIECSGCPYETACVPCAVIRSGGSTCGHCDPEVCAYMQRKYLAGLVPPAGK